MDTSKLGIREMVVQKMRDFKRIRQLLAYFRLFKKDEAAKPPVSTPELTRFYQQNQSSTIFLLFLRQPSPKIAHSEKGDAPLSFLLESSSAQHTTRGLLTLQSKARKNHEPRGARSQFPIPRHRSSLAAQCLLVPI